MKKIRLFCFPYAGGSAALYNKWRPLLSQVIDLRPVELAGRGKRINERLYEDTAAVIEDVFSLLKQEIGEGPYALFGHSMGAMIAYELAQKIRSHRMPLPLHIFFSGRGAPHVKNAGKKKYASMSDEDFRREVINLGGTPPEFFDYPELLELFLPILKNDFKIAEEDRVYPVFNPFDTDISVLLGKEDTLSPDECIGWKVHTKGICRMYFFEGGHFFLHDSIESLIEIINPILHRESAI